MYYVDTAVIVARYKPNDPLRTAAENFFSASRGARFISPLTLVELYSVYSRILVHVRFPSVLRRVADEEKVGALVEASVIDCALSPVAVSLSADWVLTEHRISVPLEYAEARRLAPRLRLRAMDLLHIAYTSLLRKTGVPIKEFVTGDEDLVGKSKRIESVVGVKVSTPQST